MVTAERSQGVDLELEVQELVEVQILVVVERPSAALLARLLLHTWLIRKSRCLPPEATGVPVAEAPGNSRQLHVMAPRPEPCSVSASFPATETTSETVLVKREAQVVPLEPVVVLAEPELKGAEPELAGAEPEPALEVELQLEQVLAAWTPAEGPPAQNQKAPLEALHESPGQVGLSPAPLVLPAGSRELPAL